MLNRLFEKLTADLGKGEDTGDSSMLDCKCCLLCLMIEVPCMHIQRQMTAAAPSSLISITISTVAPGPLEALIREVEAQLTETRETTGSLQRVWAARQTALAALQVAGEKPGSDLARDRVRLPSHNEGISIDTCCVAP